MALTNCSRINRTIWTLRNSCSFLDLYFLARKVSEVDFPRHQWCREKRKVSKGGSILNLFSVQFCSHFDPTCCRCLEEKKCQNIFFWNTIGGKHQVCISEQNKRLVVRVASMNSIDYIYRKKFNMAKMIPTKPLGRMAKLLPAAPWSPSWSLRRIPLSWAPSFVIDSQF